MKARTILPLAGAALAVLAISRARSFSYAGKRVLITGGSRGLGLTLARQLIDAGARVAICARTERQLRAAEAELRQRAAGNSPDEAVLAARCDITNPGEVQELAAAVRRWGGTIDVLINNAGIIVVGPEATMTAEDYADSMAVHFFAPLQLIREFLPAMRAQGSGRIINIASFGGLVSVPHLAPYCAGKHALVGLSDALAAELRKDGVIVTTVCPGLLRTGSHVNARFKGNAAAEQSWFSIGNANPLLSMNAERAARHILSAAAHGRSRLTLTWNARLIEMLQGALPEVSLRAAGLVNRVLPLAPASDGSGRDQAAETPVSRSGRESASPLSPSPLTFFADRAVAAHNEQ